MAINTYEQMMMNLSLKKEITYVFGWVDIIIWDDSSGLG